MNLATEMYLFYFFFSSRSRHTLCYRDWSSDVCSSDLGRLLARRRAEPDAPADLRDRVAHAGGARSPRLAPGGGEEARPPQARARAGPLYLQRGVAGRAVLAPSRLDLGARAGAVRPRGARCARLPGDLDADPRQQEALGAV